MKTQRNGPQMLLCWVWWRVGSCVRRWWGGGWAKCGDLAETARLASWDSSQQCRVYRPRALLSSRTGMHLAHEALWSTSGKKGREGQSDFPASVLSSNSFSLRYRYAKAPYSWVVHPDPYHGKIKTIIISPKEHTIFMFYNRKHSAHRMSQSAFISQCYTKPIYAASVCIIIISLSWPLFYGFSISVALVQSIWCIWGGTLAKAENVCCPPPPLPLCFYFNPVWHRLWVYRGEEAGYRQWWEAGQGE